MDVKLLLARILTRLIPANAFVVEEHKLHTSANPLTIAANGYTAETGKTFMKAGYYPVALAGWNNNGTNSSLCLFTTLHLANQSVGSVEVIYGLRSVANSQSSIYPYIYILWVKTN